MLSSTGPYKTPAAVFFCWKKHSSVLTTYQATGEFCACILAAMLPNHAHSASLIQVGDTLLKAYLKIHLTKTLTFD